MRNFAKFFGIIALSAVIGFSMAACAGDEASGGSSLVSLMSAPKASEIQPYSISGGVRIVEDMDEALELFGMLTEYVGDWGDYLKYADREALYTAIEAKYYESDAMSLLAQKSGSYSVDINDTTELKNFLGVSKASIKGSNKASESVNSGTLLEYYTNWMLPEPIPSKKGDSNSYSTSANRTINVESGYMDFWGYKVAGIIKTESSNNGSWTVQDPDEDISTGFDDYTSKVAVMLAISDGVKGAKFRFVYSSSGSWHQRGADWNGGNNCSDIEVYNNANELLFKVPPYWTSRDNWGDLPGKFAYSNRSLFYNYMYYY